MSLQPVLILCLKYSDEEENVNIKYFLSVTKETFKTSRK